MRDDGGAVAVIVAVVLSMVLVGMSALTIDVGSLFVQRRELQNGADAGALAVAKSCAAGTCDPSVATTYSNANDHDGSSVLDTSLGLSICGTFSGLSPCSTPSLGTMSPVYDCGEPAPDSSVLYAQVRTASAGTSTLTPGFFARAILGNSAYAGTTVHACSRATVLAADAGFGLSMTVSACEWEAMTANGTSFAPTPPYPPNPSTDVEINLALHDGQATSSSYPCPTGYGAGADLPGGFGWLDDPSNTCTAQIDTNNDYGASPGVAVSSVCKTRLDNAITAHTVLYLPVYSAVVGGSGQNGTYSLEGFAAFVPTGYNLPGSGSPTKRASWLTAQYCYTPLGGNPNLKCLSGFFTQGLIAAGSAGGSGSSLPGVDVLSLLR